MGWFDHGPNPWQCLQKCLIEEESIDPVISDLKTKGCSERQCNISCGSKHLTGQGFGVNPSTCSPGFGLQMSLKYVTNPKKKASTYIELLNVMFVQTIWNGQICNWKTYWTCSCWESCRFIQTVYVCNLKSNRSRSHLCRSLSALAGYLQSDPRLAKLWIAPCRSPSPTIQFAKSTAPEIDSRPRPIIPRSFSQVCDCS